MVSTTLKVGLATRERVKALSTAQHRTADQVISAALDYLEREIRRQRMREQSLAALDDPADKAEIDAVRESMDELRAW